MDEGVDADNQLQNAQHNAEYHRAGIVALLLALNSGYNGQQPVNDKPAGGKIEQH